MAGRGEDPAHQGLYRPLVAHSDGDVAIHALCDAMLGALALGDIGQHFPDTSEEYRGIDSKILLRRVDALVRSHGYAVSNADITIAAQRPKLAPYIVRMRQTLADILGVDISQVSVKATTTEHLGFTGREEGISVWASVLLNRSDGGDMQRREMTSRPRL